MSTAQILEELPRLTPSERSRVYAYLAEMHETDLLETSTPSLAERQALDAALSDFERDSTPGEPWREVFREIRSTRT